jgi:hypothetical protein
LRVWALSVMQPLPGARAVAGVHNFECSQGSGLGFWVCVVEFQVEKGLQRPVHCRRCSDGLRVLPLRTEAPF